jgi:hypothetical protein
VGNELGVVVGVADAGAAVVIGDPPDANGNESRRRSPKAHPAMTSTATIATKATTQAHGRRRGASCFDEPRAAMLTFSLTTPAKSPNVGAREQKF